MAGSGMAVAVVDQRRDLGDAALALGVGELRGEKGTTGPESAARGWVRRTGHITAEDDPLAGSLLARVGQWYRRDQSLGVRMRRRGEQPLGRCGLHDAT